MRTVGSRRSRTGRRTRLDRAVTPPARCSFATESWAFDNPALFTATGQPSVATDGTLTYIPEPYASGTSTFTVDVQDAGGTANGGQDTSAPQVFTITVNFINQPPTFVASNPPTVLENSGQASVANWGTLRPWPRQQRCRRGLPELPRHRRGYAVVVHRGRPAGCEQSWYLALHAGRQCVGTSTFTVTVQNAGDRERRPGYLGAANLHHNGRLRQPAAALPLSIRPLSMKTSGRSQCPGRTISPDRAPIPPARPSSRIT